MSAFLWEGVPVCDIRAAGGMTDMLVRTPDLGRALAETLGARSAALMRGHGAVGVGTSLPVVVFRSVYLEQNARLQAQAMTLGGPITYLADEEAQKASINVGATVQRPWELSVGGTKGGSPGTRRRPSGARGRRPRAARNFT
jgi:HCOMODA/2-hydroxy-3-carboxy-muconic semialdehyde decarboxylase